MTGLDCSVAHSSSHTCTITHPCTPRSRSPHTPVHSQRHWQVESSMAVQSLKPRIDMMKARYGDDKDKIQRETQILYKQAGVNPLAGEGEGRKGVEVGCWEEAAIVVGWLSVCACTALCTTRRICNSSSSCFLCHSCNILLPAPVVTLVTPHHQSHTQVACPPLPPSPSSLVSTGHSWQQAMRDCLKTRVGVEGAVWGCACCARMQLEAPTASAC